MRKIERLLGFVPQIDFKDGISKFTNWVLKQKIEKDELINSLEEMKSKGLLK